ncbi:hypothetical protein C8J57DRAFT_1528859 [Mycena rebaudengoi]|nr:hypothetical protein C8J57DRAFT_1528859 [Mycena rebaudengoi]
MSTAQDEVISTAELLELILAQLPLNILLTTVPLVSKTWQSATLSPHPAARPLLPARPPVSACPESTSHGSLPTLLPGRPAGLQGFRHRRDALGKRARRVLNGPRQAGGACTLPSRPLRPWSSYGLHRQSAVMLPPAGPPS